MTWILEADNGVTREVETRSEAESVQDDLEELGLNVTLKRQKAAESGAVTVTEENKETELPDSPDVTEDPMAWMPNHFVDSIEGVPTINRKGFAVLAEHYGISVTAEPVTLPSESNFEYAEFRAIATKPNGQEYSGFGSAHVDRGDDSTLLAEMAETRAMKRATAWATGVGMTAIEEMKVAEGDR